MAVLGAPAGVPRPLPKVSGGRPGVSGERPGVSAERPGVARTMQGAVVGPLGGCVVAVSTILGLSQGTLLGRGVGRREGALGFKFWRGEEASRCPEQTTFVARRRWIRSRCYRVRLPHSWYLRVPVGVPYVRFLS